MSQATDRILEMCKHAGLPVKNVTEAPDPLPTSPAKCDLYRQADGWWLMWNGSDWFSIGRAET